MRRASPKFRAWRWKVRGCPAGAKLRALLLPGGLAGLRAAWLPPVALPASSHLPATRLHLSFCIADVFLKQLDVRELDRSALLRS